MQALSVNNNLYEQIAPSTIVAGIWALATFLWSIFTRPQYTFPARVLLLQPAWLVRAITDEDTWVQDLFLFLILHSGFTLWTGAWSLPSLTPITKFTLDEQTFYLYLRVFTLLTGCGGLASAIVIRGQQLAKEAEQNDDEIGVIDENIIPPLLIPSHTTHTRLFPKKHSFGYSYLYVGVPVGNVGRFGRALSVDCANKAWFHVDGADYLERSDRKRTLADKLRSYLRSQGVTELDYEYAYLVTAPRFMGYSFNPVSFWYIYDDDTNLKYMILEVNNTFDERRMYLLRPDQQNGTLDGIDLPEPAKMTVTFSQQWEKDFHVSPFNSRKGSYSLKAVDPLTANGKPKFDNLIVLRSSKGHAKISARVYSEGQPLAPAEISSLTLARFILSWWWVGLATLPRIIWEAQKLWINRQLNLYYRPEVTAHSIGRTPTVDERKIENFFRAYVTDIAQSAKQPLRVKYSSPFSGREKVIYSPSWISDEDNKTTLILKVQSPAFYSRLVHYAHMKEAFDRECLSTDEKNRTIIIQPASLVTTFLNAASDFKSMQPTHYQWITDSWRWRLMESLRCPPAIESFPSTQALPGITINDIRKHSAADLDIYVRSHCENSSTYRRAVTKAFLAQRFALGIPALVTLFDMLLRFVLLVVAMAYIEKADFFDVLRPRHHESEDWWNSLVLLLLANGVHLLVVLKG